MYMKQPGVQNGAGIARSTDFPVAGKLKGGLPTRQHHILEVVLPAILADTGCQGGVAYGRSAKGDAGHVR